MHYDLFHESDSRVTWTRHTPDRRQSKTLLSTNVDLKKLETEFSIAICSPDGPQMAIVNTVSIIFWQAKALILSTNVDHKFKNRNFDCHLSAVVYIDFDPRSSFVKSVFDCRLSGVRECYLTRTGRESAKCN